MLTVRRYHPNDRQEWDSFVDNSKNGTFLLLRDFMEHHQVLFHDHSLLIGENDNLAALLPANEADGALHSHQGLTYGGFVTGRDMTSPRMIEVLAAVMNYAEKRKFSSLNYKTIPSIYHQHPAGEDLYALFRSGADLVRRDLLSVVEMSSRLPYQTRRSRMIKRANNADLEVHESGEWARFWPLLEAMLQEQHGVTPVHNLAEIIKLYELFPKSVRLFLCQSRGDILAGSVIFDTHMVAHAQYIMNSRIGRESGALDFLFDHLLDRVFNKKRYFDFGSSSVNDGHSLNMGLVNYKEGFGARAFVHDFYRLNFECRPCI